MDATTLHLYGTIHVPNKETELNVYKHERDYWISVNDVMNIIIQSKECVECGKHNLGEDIISEENSSKVVTLKYALSILYRLELEDFSLTGVISAIQQFVADQKKGE